MKGDGVCKLPELVIGLRVGFMRTSNDIDYSQGQLWTDP